MAEIRNRGSVLATETGIQILKDAKAAKRNQNGKMWTYQDIANESGVTNKTVERFFRREKSIDESSARAICQVLEVDFSKVIEIRSSEDAPQKKKREDKWQQVCRGMLDRQKKLSTNEVIASEAMQFDLVNDEIFVSLALVERKEPNRLSQDVHPTRSVEQYEERPPIEYEIFQEQVLEKGKSDRIAIVGEPGAGKTTLLQHIAFWILERGLGLPIWISLGNLMKNGDLQRLKDYLTQVWLEDAIPNVTQDVKSDFLEQLSKQRVWLLLDGADEIVVSSGITLREIDEKLPSWLSQVRILLTCRLNVWDADINALRDFQIYRTKEFHYPTQVEQFIENGFCRSNPSSGQSLKTELAKTEQNRLQQLVRNPLRLMMLCTTWYEQESLPATKAELYGRFVDEFYKWNRTKWRKKDLNFALFPNTKANQEKLNQALGRLACCALDKEPSPFRLSHDLVVKELGDPDEEGSDFWLALNLGWLQVARNSDKPSEKVYTFFHPTFQEYFAALAIDDWDIPTNYYDQSSCNKNYRIFKPQWKEVLLLWIGCNNILPHLKRDLIQRLVAFGDDCQDFYGGFYHYEAYFRAAAILGEFQDSVHIWKIVMQVAELAFGYINYEEQRWICSPSVIRDRAVKALKETDYQMAANILSNLLVEFKYKDNKQLENPIRIDFVLSRTVRLFSATEIEDGILYLSGFLIEFDSDNKNALNALNELLDRRSWHKLSAAHILSTADPSNLKAKEIRIRNLNAISPYLNSTAFGKIDSYEQKMQEMNVEEILSAIRQKSPKEDTELRLLIKRLGEVDPSNEEAVEVLFCLLIESKNSSICKEACLSLEKIINKNYRLVFSKHVDMVKLLREDILDIGKIHNEFSLEYKFNLVCYFAQNMDCPEFHKAWYG